VLYLLLLQNNPSLTPDTVKARLMVSADKWASPSGDTDPCTYGAGFVNILAALQSSVVATQPALSPVLAQGPNGAIYINASQIWGTRAIWGTGSLTDLRAIWGTSAIAGATMVVDGNRAIWGTSVWSNGCISNQDFNSVDLSGIVIKGE